jgi:hypothetical protein
MKARSWRRVTFMRYLDEFIQAYPFTDETGTATMRRLPGQRTCEDAIPRRAMKSNTSVREFFTGGGDR